MLKKSILVFLKNNLSLISILLWGTIFWSITMVKSGIIYPFGMGFWGANGHDGIWHLALINNILKGFPIEIPVFSGNLLQNYHIGFDLLVSLINQVTKLPITILYFQILPPVFAFLIGLLTYLFTLNWTKSKQSALLSSFFIYFGGGLGWFVTFLRNGKFDGESMFWSQQAISTLINPPFALSLIFILLGLICLHKKKLFLAILFFGVLVEIKIYAAVLVLIGLLLSKNFKVFLGTLFLSFILFVPLLGTSSKLLVWQPFWFLETMMGLSDRFGWMKFYSAMTTYRMGGIWVKVTLAYGVAFLLFLVGNMGTRIIFIKDAFKKLDSIKILILSIISAGIIIPMFFLQKGTPWNTIQFFYYSLFFSAILAGITASRFTKLLLIAVVLLTIPTTIGAMKHYLPKNPPAYLSNAELQALEFLKNQSNGIILTYPFDATRAKEAEANPPRPLYLYDSTAYVSAFANKITFLEDQVNLDITGYGWKDRRVEIENWYKEKDQEKSREFLKKNNIKYIYWLKGDKRFLYDIEQRAYLGETELGIEKIFDNKEVGVYVVKSEI